ncbi:cation:proton antiporter [Okeania sp. SIO2B3]|uniref:cation:proton antiporter n=1 Tax=Okeania sp. SIO2B3 TaxID=2607784 RepID=UPI0013C1ADB6|nr:cation:proton antiporter [Okeania sp. SIO2B3]NET40451.1 universal stress protein [Okeania sp. SIO2B3]
MLPNNPIVVFTILLLVILTIPPIFERLRLPGLVGLLVGGVVLGPHGLQLLNSETETMKLLSDIGKIYLMFVIALEIDLEQFNKTRNRSIGFGLITFFIPIIAGIIVGRIFGFGWNASILIGSLFAPHTLLGYPIVNRLGVVANEAVTVTIGATIFTDIAALLVLAICVSVNAGEFSVFSLIIQLGELAIYAVVVLFGFKWLGEQYFRRTGDEEGNQFLFIMLVVFIASVEAQIIHVDIIVGAFLAGIAVNEVVGNGPVKEKVEFIGSTLFIPFFFVDMGLILDVPAFVSTITSEFVMTLAIIAGVIISKFIAALLAKQLYNYNFPETLTMWSLTLPHVAATLVEALVGLQEGILTEPFFNGVIVLMLVTSILGPLTTARFAPLLSQPLNLFNSGNKSGIWWETHEQELEVESDEHRFTVLVSIYNPVTENYLLEMGAMLAKHESGLVVPLSIVKSNFHLDEPVLSTAISHSERQLKRTQAITQKFNVEAQPELRIYNDISQGISCTAREKNASLIIMGWSQQSGLQARLFGSIIDSVFWSSHCPVAVTRLLDDPIDIHKILVPVKNITPQALRTVRFAQLFADTNQAYVTLLHICPNVSSPEQIDEFKSQLSEIVSVDKSEVKLKIKVIANDNVAQVIIRMARSFDLVILRSMRRRTAGGLAVSDVTNEVLKELNCSLVLFGEPHS